MIDSRRWQQRKIRPAVLDLIQFFIWKRRPLGTDGCALQFSLQSAGNNEITGLTFH